MYIDPFIVVDAIRKGANNPNRFVALEIEKRRPHWRRERIMLVGGVFLIDAILLFCMLKGWDLYF